MMSFLLRRMANPRIMVRFAMLEPRTLPTESPPSPAREATMETESSGIEVITERRMKPAAISDRPKALDKASTYRMIRSLTTVISSRDTAKMGKL